MARSTKLTPAIHQAITGAISAGVPISTAARLANVDAITIYEWIQRGLGTHASRSKTPLYAEFAEAVLRARALDEARRVARIEAAGKGGAVTYRKTTRYPDGRDITEERLAPPDWQADAWHLERTRTAEWGRKERVDMRLTIEQTAQRVAAEMGLTAEEVLAEAQALLQEFDHRADQDRPPLS